MKIYYVEIYEGTHCGLELAASVAEVRRMVRDEFGRGNISVLRHATLDDVTHVRNAGGRVPELPQEVTP